MWLVKNRTAILALAILVLLAIDACLPKPPSETGGGTNITLYGFSIMKESLEKAIYPAFSAIGIDGGYYFGKVRWVF